MDNEVARLRSFAEFGAYRLYPSERLLEYEGDQVNIGSRALDLLILLVERAGEVVSKDDLMTYAWPNLTVDESSLRFHIAGLRRILGDGKSSVRYVTNVPGRGYCFVGPLSHRPAMQTVAPGNSEPELPHLLQRMVGRDDMIRRILHQLDTKRFVTVVGPGGIGKTTVTVAAAHKAREQFEDKISFIDLGAIKEPNFVAGALAASLGLPAPPDGRFAGLVAALRDRRMLMILDSCEHVIDAIAELTERIYQEAPQVSLLATSREPLRVEGEHVLELAPLDQPPDTIELSAAQVLSFAAASLFAERAAASGYQHEITDADAQVVTRICRKLDGIPLALELAAGRAATHGLQEIEALLDGRLRLLWRGRRTALPRQQTLSATLDWSYDLISERERSLLRRLAIFVGPFTLEAAQAVAAADGSSGADIIEGLEQLVAKSLVFAGDPATTARYRLLDTTRAYAQEKLAENGDWQATAQRHASHIHTWLNGLEIGALESRSDCSKQLGNIRAALEWSFAEDGETALGVEIAARAGRVFIEHSLLDECRYWASTALAALEADMRGTYVELDLQAALGHAQMYTRGNGDEARLALERGLEVAKELEDPFNEFRILSRLHMYARRVGSLDHLLPLARRTEEIAAQIGDPVGIALADIRLGVSHHLVGNQLLAQEHLEASLRRVPSTRNVRSDHFAFFRHTNICFARCLWLQGYPEQAATMAHPLLTGTPTQDGVTFAIGLIWGASVFQWSGDWPVVAAFTERLIDHATRQSLAPYLTVGNGLKGTLQIQEGQLEKGIDQLQEAIAGLRADLYELYTPEFECTLAEALARTGDVDQGLDVIEKTIVRVEANGGAFNLPDLLRVRGQIRTHLNDADGAKADFNAAIKAAVRQSALSWQLRAETDRARFLAAQDQAAEAREALAATYARFSEGFETADLIAARQLLNQLA